MARPGLNFEKTNGNLGRQATTNDMVTGMVVNAVATADMVLGTIYPITSLAAAEDLGLNDAYDTDNEVLVYHRIKRLFVHNPSIKLYILPVAQDVTLVQMADKANDHLAKLLRDKAGEIVQAFIARNPDDQYVPTIEDGLNDEVIAAVYKAQELAEYEFEKGRPVDLFVEGRNFTGTAAAVTDLHNLVTDCPDVTVAILADNDISISNALFAKYAAVEDYVAMASKAAVSQNAGELIPEFNLTKPADGIFLNPGLSSGLKISEYSEPDIDILNNKGYIVAINQGVPGVHILDTHTCDDEESDYNKLENNRTIKKAVKLIRAKILPRVKGRLYVDPDTGKIAPEDIKELEAITESALDPMLNDRDLSGGVDAYINPEQNILSTSKFDIEFSCVPVAIGRRITIKYGFNNPLNN